MIHDPNVCRLGKKAAKPPRIMLEDYVHDAANVFQSAPGVVVNSNMPGLGAETVPLGMYLNDQEGDCTCAAVGNTLRVNSRGSVQLTDADIQAAYVAVTGQEGAAYNPTTGANDNGCVPLDVLDYWVANGIGGNKLVGHAGVNMKDYNQVRWCLWKLGSVYQGIQLAVEQQNQVVWNYVPGSTPGSWGGHLFPLFDHPQGGVWTGATWKLFKRQTYEFMIHQADEGHGLITTAFLNENADVVDSEQLESDLWQLAPEK